MQKISNSILLPWGMPEAPGRALRYRRLDQRDPWPDLAGLFFSNIKVLWYNLKSHFWKTEKHSSRGVNTTVLHIPACLKWLATASGNLGGSNSTALCLKTHSNYNTHQLPPSSLKPGNKESPTSFLSRKKKVAIDWQLLYHLKCSFKGHSTPNQESALVMGERNMQVYR